MIFFPHFIEQTIFLANLVNQLLFYEKTYPPPPHGIKWPAPKEYETLSSQTRPIFIRYYAKYKTNQMSLPLGK